MTYPYNDVRVDVIKVLSKLMAYNVGHVVWKLALSVPLSHQCIINLKNSSRTCSPRIHVLPVISASLRFLRIRPFFFIPVHL